ncbi:MAG: cysteine-rich CWC family protein [Bacteroidota bacterium]|nr:cysteine-rich CWC family protein [Bacteroidota bacterium]MDP3144896.1 cysteine-rich CWC family protein [Bacteroidota bacterium]
MIPEYTINFTPENCPRCKDEFICKPKNLSTCDCMKIRLSPEEQNFISEKFSTCVCNKCLKEMKHEYLLNYQKNNPQKLEA